MVTMKHMKHMKHTKHAIKKAAVVLVAMCLLTGQGAVLASESEDPVVDVGTVETDNSFGLMISRWMRMRAPSACMQRQRRRT